MRQPDIEEFLSNSDGSLNKHETVLWGHHPGSPEIEVQFLRGSADEYLRRAKKANDEMDGQLKKSSLLDGPLGVAVGVLALAPGAVFLIAGMTGADLGRWVPVLGISAIALISIIILRTLSKFRERSNARVLVRLRERLKRVHEGYVEFFALSVDADDLRERRGVSPVRAAMDRITSDARDALVALLKKRDEEAVEHIMRTLIEEERDLIDGQRYAERGANAARIADITAQVLKKTK